jgi:hypothetical protein
MNIQKGYDYAKNPYQNQNKPAVEESQKKTTTSTADTNTDKFNPNETAAFNANYSRGANRTDRNNINPDDVRSKTGRSARQLKNDAVRNMVESQVNSQTQRSGYKPLFGGNSTIMDAFNKAEATSAKHDDFWGVEATAERIFTFARTLAGDDDSMFQTMKDAFLKGFRAALGSSAGGGRGSLPDISFQTRDRVLEMFDKWEEEIKARQAGNAQNNNNQANNNTNNANNNTQAANTSFSGGNKVPITGAGKFGGGTPAPTTFSGGNKVPHFGMAPPPAPKPTEPTEQATDTAGVPVAGKVESD